VEPQYRKVGSRYGPRNIAGNGFKSLDEGAKVSFEATQGRKGMQADNVSRI
jgi:CspA family cold shock protein